MGIFLRGLGMLAAAMLATMTTVWAQTADPPGRIGRLAFINGTVSFHDRNETNWQPAAINYPMTSGNALWTEPNGRAELFVGGTRIRMQSSTQLETLALTDDQFQLRVSQGRIDVKPVGLQQGQQIEILTPRGSAMLVGDGDYMIEAGTTDDATRVGVRTGSARVIASNGTELIVHAGEIGVLTGTAPPVFEVVRQATPPMPAEWATRDRQYVTTQTVQYAPTSMTGYEELDYYGTWSTVGTYGRVWSPRTMPVGWEPYRQGRWRWVDPWGWTWIDDQPWAFAPSHYGRWVNQGGRWYWVPPAREARPVYAPAVVGFVDVAAAGAALAIGASIAPVGWFPLGPREVYVPPYTADRAYIRRVNAAYVQNTADIDRRIEYAERYRRDDPRRADPRRDARPGLDTDRPIFINQRYATVVPQQAFLRGDRVDRAAIRVDANQLARVQAAPVAAPMVAPSAAVTPPPAQPGRAPVPDAKPGQPPVAAAPQGADVQRAPLADIPVLGRPNRQDRPTTQAPGPQFSRTQPAAPGATAAPTERQLPNLRTRDGREVERTAPSQAAPAAPPAQPAEPPKPGVAPPAKPGEPPKAAEPPKPPQAPVAPPVAAPPVKPDQPKAAEPPKPPQAPVAPPVATPPAKPDQPKAAEPPKPPQAPVAPPVAAPPAKPDQPKAAEPPKPPQAPVAPPVAAPPKPPVTPPQAAEPPKAPVAPPRAAQPPSPPAAPPVQQAKPPEPPKAVQPPSPPPAPQARPPEPPRPAPQQAAPPPQPRPQAPPAPPPQQAKPPAPPAAPPPQQAKPPAQSQPQGKPPEQAKQPREKDDKGGDDRRR